MSSGLKELRIEHLRGAVRPFSLSFDKGKKLTVVYGENGTGKSTICDALEFLGNGKVGSLENRGLGKPQKFYPSVGKTSAQVSVTLENNDGTKCSATLHKADVIATPAKDRPKIEALRRSQILALVEAKPADRYAAISRFVDVSGIEQSESHLRTLVRDLIKSRELAVTRIDENRETISQFWRSAGSPGKNALSWGESESQQDHLSQDSEVRALQTLQAAFSKLVDFQQRFLAARHATAVAITERADATNVLAVIVEQNSGEPAEIVKVLQTTREYLATHRSPDACPVCESSERVTDLDERVAARLAALSELVIAQSAVSSHTASVSHLENRLTELRIEFAGLQTTFTSSAQAYTWASDISLPASSIPAEAERLGEWLATAGSFPDNWKKAELNRSERKQFLTALKAAYNTYTENLAAQTELATLIPRVERALAIVEEERHAFTDGILTKIADDVGRIYELVHPGEGLNKISLALDPNKRASLEIGADFCGESAAPPQAYFSESHLDTLGLCVFLALAGLDSPGNTILVLDDVLASVDEPHVERLIEMLYSEATKFRHCVITTHYRPWKQKLRWGWLKNGQCQFVELTRWTTSGGLTLIRSIPDVDRLRDLLNENSPDPQLICAKAGVILEAALDFLTQLYECSVPRRNGGLYALGDLLPSIKGKLRGALAVEVLATDASGTRSYTTNKLAPLLDELTRIAQARNVIGCHFNELSFELLDSDGLLFGTAVLSLIELLADPEAGWPRSDKSGKYWANSGETRRLHPLKHPS